MYLTIYKIARNKVKINTDQYWIQKKKKKKDLTREGNYYTYQLFLRQLIYAFD